MNTKKQLYLISYDVSENGSRTRLARLLIRWGYERLQYSVFIGLHHPVRIKTLRQEMQSYIGNEDRLLVLEISKKAFMKMKIIGKLPLPKEYLSGDMNTLFFD